MTSKMLLEQYMAERHALGFSLKTDEGCIRRFLQDFAEPDDGEISFTKEYALMSLSNCSDKEMVICFTSSCGTIPQVSGNSYDQKASCRRSGDSQRQRLPVLPEMLL